MQGTAYMPYFYANINKHIIPEISNSQFLFINCPRNIDDVTLYHTLSHPHPHPLPLF